MKLDFIINQIRLALIQMRGQVLQIQFLQPMQVKLF